MTRSSIKDILYFSPVIKKRNAGRKCNAQRKGQFLSPLAQGVSLPILDEVIVIRDVPAYVCRQCGEAYFSAETSEKIDIVMEAVHQGTICCRPLAAGEITLPA